MTVLPDYQETAKQLYNVCVNQDVGVIIAIPEIIAALKHAERVGYTKGVEEAESRWWREQDEAHRGD